jgi:hypothetical protein
MKNLLLFAAALAAAACLAPATRAEVLNNSAELAGAKRVEAYIYSRASLTELAKQAQAQDDKFGIDIHCNDAADKVTPQNLIVISPIDLPDDASQPVKGAWLVRYSFVRCGNEKIYNAVFLAHPGNPPLVQAYSPGAPRAGPPLIKQAMGAMLAAAKQRSSNPACKEYSVFDMRVTEQPHDAVEQGTTVAGVWREVWTFRACGVPIDVPVKFVPDAKLGGTDFVIEPAKSK